MSQKKVQLGPREENQETKTNTQCRETCCFLRYPVSIEPQPFCIIYGPMQSILDHDLVWFGTGAAVAVEAADVTLFTSDLTCMADLVRLGYRTRQTILQNVTWAVVTKVRLDLLLFD
jgi:hypothetical protein